MTRTALLVVLAFVGGALAMLIIGWVLRLFFFAMSYFLLPLAQIVIIGCLAIAVANILVSHEKRKNQ